MMKLNFAIFQRILLFVFATILYQPLEAQTGPGGVGNTSSNCLWLKANAGTSTTTDGANLSGWNDVSGNGNNVSQATVNKQPLFRSSVINGMPALEFDNVSAHNDNLQGVDNPTLDNCPGLTIFTVSRPTALNGEARSIIAKRVNVGVDQSYMFFYYTGNYFHTDVVSNNDRFTTSPTTFASNNNYLLDLLYDGTQPAASRSKVYSAQTLIATGYETSASIPDFNSPLLVGTTHTADNRPFGGYISEIIIYREALNDACRIIVDNYLSAKYAIALSANDFYAGDTPGNGDFDQEVAGIGQSAAGSANTQFSPAASAGMGLTYVSGFQNGDYVLAGHRLPVNANINTDIAVVSGGPIDRRWERIWYIDVTNTGAAVQANITFDLSDGGFPSIAAGVSSNYKLLYRATNSGNWTIAATASSVSGDQVIFNGYSFAGNAQDGYYTIATLNNSLSPLPIALLDFNAVLNNQQVDLSWTTASETNNDYFTIERSADGSSWTNVEEVDGAGNSNMLLHYTAVDASPLAGQSYYRLKQTDFDSRYSYAEIVPVNNVDGIESKVRVFPNPVHGNTVTLLFTGFSRQPVRVTIHDMAGRQVHANTYMVSEGNTNLSLQAGKQLGAGIYTISITSGNRTLTQKLVVN